MLQGGVQSNFGSYNAAHPDTYTLERVEVLRGQSPVLYGQGGIGGVVNLVSKRPMATSQGEVQVQIGEVHVRGLERESAGKLGRDWDWSAGYANTDATISHSNGADNGERRSAQSPSCWPGALTNRARCVPPPGLQSNSTFLVRRS